jgi:hypothetical protein
MRLLHAFGLSLVWSGVAHSLTGLCATADAQPSYRAARDAEIAEFKAPRREGYDKVVVQLAPLSPVRGARKPVEARAEPPVTAPATSAAATPVPSAEPASAPMAAAREIGPAPEAMREDAPTEVEIAAPASEPAAAAPLDVAPHAFVPDAEGAPATPLADIAAERAPVLASEAASTSDAVAEPPLAVPGAPLAIPEAPEPVILSAPHEPVAPVAAGDGEAPDADAAPAPDVAAPIVAQEVPPQASAHEAQDAQEDPGSWSWSLLTFVVALASLAGFAVMRRRQTRGVASALPAAPAREDARLRGLVASLREKLAQAFLAMLERLRDRKGSAKPAGAEPEPDWARIATTLRERAGSAAAGAAPAREDSAVAHVPAPKAETKRWEQDREDGVELLEPGSNSARALVMNARRKLQAVGER